MLAVRILIVLCVLATAGVVYFKARAPETALANAAVTAPEDRMEVKLDENGVKVRQTVQVYDLNAPPTSRKSALKVFLKTFAAIMKGDKDGLFPGSKDPKAEKQAKLKSGGEARISGLPGAKTSGMAFRSQKPSPGTKPRDFTIRN